jgi:hypothetical protein
MRHGVCGSGSGETDADMSLLMLGLFKGSVSQFRQLMSGSLLWF